MPDEPNNTTPPADATPPAESKPAENMLKVLGYYTDDQQQEQVPKPDAGETETPPAEDAPADPPAKDEPAKDVVPPAPPDPNRARKVKPEAESRPNITKEEISAAVKEAIRPAATEPKPDPLAKYGELLLPEKRSLELAQFAAAAMPEKYKEMEAKEVAWITKNREFIQARIDEDGAFDPDTDQYRDLVRKHKPTYQAGDREELFLLRAEQRAEAKASEKFKTELEQRDRRINEMEVRPIITKVINTVEDDILSVLDKPIAEAIKADKKKAMETHGVEAPLAIAIITDTQHNASEYIALAKGAAEYNENNPVHVKLVQFIKTQGQFLENIPEAQRLRDGKPLISRERYAKIPKESRSQYVTFTDGDILDMLAVGGRNYLQATIKGEYARLEKAGFKRPGAQAAPVLPKPNAPAGEKKETATAVPPKPAAKPAAAQPPKGGATPAPGAGGATKPAATTQDKGVLTSLGYDKV